MNSFIKKSLLTIVGLSLLSIFGAFISNVNYAQSAESSDKYQLLAPIPCIAGQGVTCPNGEIQTRLDFKEYVQYTFNLLIALAGVAAVFMIVYGGFKYITTASAGEKDAGRKTIEQAVYGLLLVLGSYLLLRTINPKLVEIPNAIVPKLTIKVDPKNTVQSALADLQNLANGYRVDISSVQNEVNQQEKQIDSLTTQKKALEAQLEELKKQGISEDDPRIKNLQAQIQNAQNQITSTTASQLTKIGIGSMQMRFKSLVDSLSSDYSLKNIETILADQRMDNIRYDFIIDLNNAGEPNHQPLDQEYEYLKAKLGLLAIDKLTSQAYRKADIQDLLSVIPGITTHVTDPIKRKEIDDGIKKYQELIKNHI